MEGFEKLLNRWNETYFTEPLMGLIEMIAIIAGFLYIKKNKLRNAFLFYIALEFTILIINFYVFGFSTLPKKERNYFLCFSNILISYIELLVYYYYFSKTLQSLRIKKFMKISFVFFTLVIALFLKNNFQYLSIDYIDIYSSIGALEFMLIIPACLTYFLELFDDPATDLFKRPSFWITSGIFFFAVVSIPFYLLNNFLSSNSKENWFLETASLLYYLPFAINFMFLTRAFLCRKPLTI